MDAYDLPQRRDIESLTRHLERVAIAVERLESAYRASSREFESGSDGYRGADSGRGGESNRARSGSSSTQD
jgi:hypothetical protein